MLRKKRLIVLLAAAVILCAVGVAAAFMLRRAQTQVDFAPAEVSCVVHEKVNGTEQTASAATGDVKSDITVENTGNIPAYLRVRVSSCWVDDSGRVTGTPSGLPAITLRQGWIDGGDGTYYYTAAVEPGKRTAVLCDPFLLTTSMSPTGTTVYQQVTVLAEAVQALPEKAVQEAWAVTVTDGLIVSVGSN